MTRQDDNICKRIESTEKFVPFSPSATSYGMGWKTLQAVRYRESPASGEFSLPPVSRHGLVLTIRPAERLEVRYEGVRLDRPPAAELRTGGLGGSLLVESVANVLAVHLIRYITGPGRLKAAADERSSSWGQMASSAWPRLRSALASRIKATFAFILSGSPASRRDGFRDGVTE